MITYYVVYEDGTSSTEKFKSHRDFQNWTLTAGKGIADYDYEETDDE